MAYETKLIRRLRNFQANENRELGRMKTVASVLAVTGWLGMIAACLEAIEPHWPLWGIVLSGIVGGFCAASSIMLNASQRQWRVIVRFLNIEAIERASLDN
jgi:hypothetical protein